jgi:hypothetical protein
MGMSESSLPQPDSVQEIREAGIRAKVVEIRLDLDEENTGTIGERLI